MTTKPIATTPTPAFSTRLRIGLVCLIAGISLSPHGILAQTNDVALSEHIRHHLETAFESGSIEIGERRLIALPAVRDFYQGRIYDPAWIAQSRVLPAATELIEAIDRANSEGLLPEEYHLNTMRHLLSVLARSQDAPTGLLGDLDLLLTDAFLAFGSHLSKGRVAPQVVDPETITPPDDVHVVDVLRTAIDRNAIIQGLDALRPADLGYARLRSALQRYEAIARRGGWYQIPDGDALSPGTNDPRVGLLRARLAATGDLAHTRATDGDPNQFDGELEQSLRVFQKRHGLEANGQLDHPTLAALNVPAAWRARQLALNLERWRWLPHDLGQRHIKVHIAGFVMEVVEGGRTVLELPVITGRTDRKTPVFSALMTYLVLNPHWYVPRSIAVADKLPLIKKDPQYLARQQYKVFSGWEDDAEELDPLTINWENVNATNFTYQLRQEPGAHNALGLVKFMFPNQVNVYMHDTPQRELFDFVERSFSSGCVRLQRPFELVDYLMDGDRRWSGDAIEQVIALGTEMTVSLPRPIPVHLIYMTAWVDDTGMVQFRRDMYNRDNILDKILRDAQS